MSQDFNIWEGIFGSFEEVSTDGPAFESKHWLKTQSTPFSDLADTAIGLPEARQFARMRDYAFPVVLAMLLEQRKHLRILDFGGGAGSRLLEALGSTPAADRVAAVVVDNAALCEKGNAHFSNIPGVEFAPELPDSNERFDIVHCGSSLHYVEDWYGLIDQFRSYQPRYLLLSDLPVGNIPTFVTAQNYYGNRIPVWMWNWEEFGEKIESLGYRVVFDCAFVAKIRKRLGPLPMDNLPASHRLDHTRHLLLSLEQHPSPPMQGAQSQ